MHTIGDYVKATKNEKKDYLEQFEQEGRLIIQSNLTDAKINLFAIENSNLGKVDKIFALAAIYNRSLL